MQAYIRYKISYLKSIIIYVIAIPQYINAS